MTIDEAIEHAKDISKKVNCKECADEHEQLVKWLEELKHYKELEEQGRLIELPCAIGDVVYVNDECEEYKLYGFESQYKGNLIYRAKTRINEDESEEIEFNKMAIGKTVFLTEEEVIVHQNQPNHIKDIVYKFSILSDAKKRNLLRVIPCIEYCIDEPIEKLINEIRTYGLEEKFLEQLNNIIKNR